MVSLFRQLLAAALSIALAGPAFCNPYDAVGNRTQITSTLAPVPAGLFNYDANDRFTAGDTYDYNGNTVTSGGIANVYDFENHLIQQDGVTLAYDGDGNRVSKTIAGATTKYLVDTENPTGYAQVIAEISGPLSNVQIAYVYGLEQISQNRRFASSNPISYYVHDGHGSVRALTDPTGAVTDSYDYDAFGNLIHSSTTLSSPTPNNYLFAGEQFDSDLHLYYNRARYLNVSTGRFWTMDTVDGASSEPASLHKYLYTGNDPVNRSDPSGHDFDIGSALTSAYVSVSLTISSYPTAIAAFQYASAALTVGLFAADQDFRAVYVASGGNPVQALTTEFATMLDEAGPTIAKEVVQETAETEGFVGARFARITTVQPGERFVRVAAKPEELNFSFKSPGGARAGTYAFPENVFAEIGQDPQALQDFGDLPKVPVYYRVITPPAGIAVQRGVVPGGQFGGRGGVPEVFFPEEF